VSDVRRGPVRLSIAFAGMMLLQAVGGLVWPGLYRDVAWIAATWFGNDLVTLVAAVPALCWAMYRARSGSPRARICWLGVLAYGVYNYAFYMLGAALNVWFPLYVGLVVVAAIVLLRLLVQTSPAVCATSRVTAAPARLVGGYLLCVATGLSAVWLGMWGAHVFAGRPTPVAPEAFRLVAALDMSMIVPLLVAGGVLLWRRHVWGAVVAGMAGVQASVYLGVLSVNAVVAVRRGLVAAPGELPLWGTLAVLTAAATTLLLARVDRPPA
jgi:hypothetical protein